MVSRRGSDANEVRIDPWTQSESTLSSPDSPPRRPLLPSIPALPPCSEAIAGLRRKHITHKGRLTPSAGLVQPKGAVEGSCLTFAATFIVRPLCWRWHVHGILLPPFFARREAISNGVNSAIGHHQITSLEEPPKRGMSRTILNALSLAIPMNSERSSPLFRWVMSLALTRRVGMDVQLDIRQAMVATSVGTNLRFMTFWVERLSWARPYGCGPVCESRQVTRHG